MKIISYRNIVWEKFDPKLPTEWKIEPSNWIDFEQVTKELSLNFQILEDFEQENNNKIVSLDVHFGLMKLD